MIWVKFWLTFGVMCVVRGTGTDDIELRRLPVSSDHVEELAMEVCMYFSDSESHCLEKIMNPEEILLESPPAVQVRCQTNRTLTLGVAPSPHTRVVFLAPHDFDRAMPASTVLHPGEEYQKLDIMPSNYTIWSMVMDKSNSPSLWRRGPEVRPWMEVAGSMEQKDYAIETKYLRYDKDRKEIISQISWSNNDDADACFNVMSFCTKRDQGDTVTKYFNPDDPRVLEVAVPVHDNCTFRVQGRGSTTLRYTTPTCQKLPGCTPRPELPSQLHVSAAADGDAWQVTVRWAAPLVAPDTYNVFVLADNNVSVVVDGNATCAVARGVRGAGLYAVSVAAARGDVSARTSRRAVFPPAASRVWAGAAGAAAAAAALAALAVARRLRARRACRPGLVDIPKECSVEVCEDGWELAPSRLALHEVIGEGAFGVVRRATLAPAGIAVAVKMLKDYPSAEEIRSFMAEMELMKSVGAHAHVVSLMGCCSGRRPLIVAQYCSRGDLLTYLRCAWNVMVSKRHVKHYNNLEPSNMRNDDKKQKETSKLVVNKLYDLEGVCDSELTSRDLLSFCRQIAMGMEFLASNRVVHRDLAARNILVTEDRTLKIADFGLSRDVYQDNQYKQKGNGKMPVRWMAPESLTHRIYTTQSDVWSFGVVMWEVWSLGGAPYAWVPAARLPRLLRAGYRLPRPACCSLPLYSLMQWCWAGSASARPSFAALHARLDELLSGACAGDYLALEPSDEPPPPTPRSLRYLRMIIRDKRLWSRSENYERPMKAPQSNHYTSPPAILAKPQIV